MYEMKKRKKETKRASLAITSLVLGITSFIPLVGILLGLLAIIFGIVSLIQIKKRSLRGAGLAIWGIILGVLGLLFTIAIYGTLFYILFHSEAGGPFNAQRIEVTKKIIIQNKGLLELYKKDYGRYPENLTQLEISKYDFYPMDHFLTPFYYNVSSDGKSYELKSAGPDKEFGTPDDIS